ncbi:hypothetical protein OAO55_02875 [Bacteroidales bacterium]|nr:hypothetical protein [Bacteroidales bacterium]
MINKNIFKYSVAAITLLILVSNAIAQPGSPPGGGGGGEMVGGGTGVPLDGGAIALLVAGSGMLYKKFFGKKKE